MWKLLLWHERRDQNIWSITHPNKPQKKNIYIYCVCFSYPPASCHMSSLPAARDSCHSDTMRRIGMRWDQLPLLIPHEHQHNGCFILRHKPASGDFDSSDLWGHTGYPLISFHDEPSKSLSISREYIVFWKYGEFITILFFESVVMNEFVMEVYR